MECYYLDDTVVSTYILYSKQRLNDGMNFAIPVGDMFGEVHERLLNEGQRLRGE